MKHPFSRRRRTLVLGLAFLMILTVAAYAAISPLILATGTNADAPLVSGPAAVTFRHLTTTPNDIGAWHYHPGYVHNVVLSGAIKIEDGCGESQTYSTGQAFETSEGRVHRAINEETVDAVEYNVFIREEGKPLTRFIAGNEQRCGPVSKVDECMNSGWATFDFPTTFANQGECVKYARQRPQVNLLVPQDPLQ